MSSHAVRLVWRADAPARSLHHQFQRFRDEVRSGVVALAARHPRLADLAFSFPALAVALSHGRTDPTAATALVAAGAPLAAAAEAAGVPLWLKKLPPECFFGPLPPMPDTPEFVRQIANHLPRHRHNAKAWLEAVALAAYWGNDAFAVWMAREVGRVKQRIRTLDRQQVRRLALWAWFSERRETRGYALMEKRFNPAMSMTTAKQWAGLWIDAVDLHLNIGERRLDDAWFVPDTVEGYDFIPLATAAEIVEEARAMENCLRTYGSALAHNRARLWSVRKNGMRIATLRLACQRNVPLPDVCELRLKRNAEAPFELWWVAHQWLRRHDLRQIACARVAWDEAPIDTAIWRDLWRPWWLSKRRLPKTLPLTPTRYLVNWL